MSNLPSEVVHRMAKHRRRLSLLLTIGIGTAFVLLIAVVLSLILKMAQDATGFQAVRGVAYVCGAALFCELVALIICSTLAVIALLDAAHDDLSATSSE